MGRTEPPTRRSRATARRRRDFAAHEDQAKALAVQPDGKIVVAGYSVGLDSGDVPATDFALARYKADGTLDSTFSGDGMRTTNFGGDAAAYDVVLQPDGRILVAGSSSEDLALARYEPDGRLDHTFSGDGKVTVRFGGWPATGAHALVLRGNGKIVAAGGKAGKFALVGFDPDGTLDSGFGHDGIVVTTPLTGGVGRIREAPRRLGLALIDDRLLAAGRATATSRSPLPPQGPARHRLLRRRQVEDGHRSLGFRWSIRDRVHRRWQGRRRWLVVRVGRDLLRLQQRGHRPLSVE